MEEVADSWFRGPTGEGVWYSICSFGLFGGNGYLE